MDSRHKTGCLIAAAAILPLFLPVLFVLLLPALIFGGLTNASSPDAPDTVILNSDTAITETANEISFTINGVLNESLEDVMARIQADFALRTGIRWRSSTLTQIARYITPACLYHNTALTRIPILPGYPFRIWKASCAGTKNTSIPLPGQRNFGKRP